MLHLWPPGLNSAQQCLLAGTTSNTQTLQTAFQTTNVSWILFCLNLLQKGIFSLSVLPPSSPSPLPPQAVGQRKSRILSYVSCVPSCEHCESEALPGLAQEAAFHHPTGETARQTLTKHLRNPTATYSPSGASEGPDWHLGMSLYKSGFNYRHPHTAVTRQLPYRSRIAVFYGQTAAEILQLLL